MEALEGGVDALHGPQPQTHETLFPAENSVPIDTFGRFLATAQTLVRLTADRDPVVVPAIACHYLSDAPDRLTLEASRHADIAAVRARAAMLNA